MPKILNFYVQQGMVLGEKNTNTLIQQVEIKKVN